MQSSPYRPLYYRKSTISFITNHLFYDEIPCSSIVNGNLIRKVWRKKSRRGRPSPCPRRGTWHADRRRSPCPCHGRWLGSSPPLRRRASRAVVPTVWHPRATGAMPIFESIFQVFEVDENNSCEILFFAPLTFGEPPARMSETWLSSRTSPSYHKHSQTKIWEDSKTPPPRRG